MSEVLDHTTNGRMHQALEIATPAEANQFYNQGMEQLNGLLVGEEDAKLASLLTKVMGRNGVYMGGTGSGKTELARDGWRLLDIPTEDVVHIDTKDDLEGKEVTGAYVPTRETEGGMSKMIFIPGMIKPDSRILIANEINRTSPSALNTMLEIFENREMEVGGHIVRLAKLEYTEATMNPGERKQNVHTLSQANASRFEIGAVMGENPDSNRRRSEAIHLHDFKPANPSAIITIAGLHAIRRYAQQGVSYPQATGRHAIGVVEKIGAAFSRRGVNEKGGRLDVHVKQTAKAIAALYGSAETTPENVDQASRFIIAAVVGMTTTKGLVEVANATDEVLG